MGLGLGCKESKKQGPTRASPQDMTPPSSWGKSASALSNASVLMLETETPETERDGES